MIWDMLYVETCSSSYENTRVFFNKDLLYMCTVQMYSTKMEINVTEG
jgi:hypothetical protein